MQIFVKILTGETITIRIDPTDDIEQIKFLIQNEVGYPADQ